MMDLNKLYSEKRVGKNNPTTDVEIRTEFQRDFDRIIFSSAFRRLQNKTQVFPLPGSVFVHNRLTHSLEVASVGRSLGTSIGEFIARAYEHDLTPKSQEFYKYSLSSVLAAACLCHDIGNPAFGHSGEDAISSYFVKNENILKAYFTKEQWQDFVNFEGNANAIRILTQHQPGKVEGGLKLTYSILAAIAKYPCESIAKDENYIHRKKFGFFQAELQIFNEIASATSMIKETENPLVYLRHPFVWLVEAADDICYNIIDLEDSHRLGIIENSECIEMLISLIKNLHIDNIQKIKEQIDKIGDKNDKVAYLRAKAIHSLTMASKNKYEHNLTSILNGSYSIPLFNSLKKECKILEDITKFSYEYIYNHRSVVEIENAGYNVMYKLLSHFIPAIIKNESERIKSEKKALKLVPPQFIYTEEDIYKRVLGILDYVSGMTDNYATDLYRKIEGIDIGMTL